jgi:hypothetical protein
LPHYAEGAGWSTDVILVNPGDQEITGFVRFFGKDGEVRQAAYAVARRSVQVLRRNGLRRDVQSGWALVSPGKGPAPFLAGVVSIRVNGILTSQAQIASVSQASAFRMYAEKESGFAFGRFGSTETGIAIANPSAADVNVLIELRSFEGRKLTPTATRRISGQGHLAFLLNEIPEFGAAASTQGIVRVWTESGEPLVMAGLRARYNERGDFLVAALPVMNEKESGNSTERILAMLVDGGGASTEIKFFPQLRRSGAGVVHMYSGPAWVR